MDNSVTIQSIWNQNEKEFKVLVEPWAAEFAIPPKSTLKIKILHTEPGEIETVVDPNCLTIWLWRGCRAEVSLDGRDQTPSFMSTPAPL
jgi:hypothetical protein